MEYHMLILVVTGILGFSGFFIGNRLPITAEEEKHKALSDAESEK